MKCLTKEILWNVSEERKGKVESCWLWNFFKNFKCYVFKRKRNIWNVHMKGICEMPHKRIIWNVSEERKGKVERYWLWNVYKKQNVIYLKGKQIFEMLTWKEYVKYLTKEILRNVSEERKGKVESCWLTRWYFSPTPMYSSVGLPSWANNDVPEIQFAIWDKYILQFKTNIFVNLRQILFSYYYVLLSEPAIVNK